MNVLHLLYWIGSAMKNLNEDTKLTHHPNIISSSNKQLMIFTMNWFLIVLTRSMLLIVQCFSNTFSQANSITLLVLLFLRMHLLRLNVWKQELRRTKSSQRNQNNIRMMRWFNHKKQLNNHPKDNVTSCYNFDIEKLLRKQ